jgi:hypothetical protein
LEGHQEALRNGSTNKYSLLAPPQERGRSASHNNDRHKPLSGSFTSQHHRGSERRHSTHHTFPSGSVYLSPDQQTGCALIVDSGPPSQNHRRFSTGLDNLALVALTSPPSITSTPSPDRLHRENPASDVAPVSFPSFPHDIFHADTEPPSPSWTSLRESSNTSRNKRNNSLVVVEFDEEGLPPKEVVDILFAH